MFGGEPPGTAIAETYDGTSLDRSSRFKYRRANTLLAAGRTSTNALAFFGNQHPVNTGITETWDGSSWTEVADLNTARDI